MQRLVLFIICLTIVFGLCSCETTSSYDDSWKTFKKQNGIVVVTFEPENGEEKKTRMGKENGLVESFSFSRDGYEFLGWFDVHGNRMDTGLGYVFTTTTDMTVYARWEKYPEINIGPVYDDSSVFVKSVSNDKVILSTGDIVHITDFKEDERIGVLIGCEYITPERKDIILKEMLKFNFGMKYDSESDTYSLNSVASVKGENYAYRVVFTTIFDKQNPNALEIEVSKLSAKSLHLLGASFIVDSDMVTIQPLAIEGKQVFTGQIMDVFHGYIYGEDLAKVSKALGSQQADSFEVILKGENGNEKFTIDKAGKMTLLSLVNMHSLIIEQIMDNLIDDFIVNH